VLGICAGLKDYFDPLAAFVAWGHLHPAYLMGLGGVSAIGNCLLVDHGYHRRQAELDAIRNRKRRGRSTRR